MHRNLDRHAQKEGNKTTIPDGREISYSTKMGWALVAADAFIVPTSPEYLALEGLISLTEAVDKIHQGIGDKCHLLGIVLTNVDRRRRVTDDVIQLIRRHYRDQVFKAEIRTDVKLVEAPSFGKDIFDYASGSAAAMDTASWRGKS